jgi:hypothetical protein
LHLWSTSAFNNGGVLGFRISESYLR